MDVPTEPTLEERVTHLEQVIQLMTTPAVLPWSQTWEQPWSTSSPILPTPSEDQAPVQHFPTMADVVKSGNKQQQQRIPVKLPDDGRDQKVKLAPDIFQGIVSACMDSGVYTWGPHDDLTRFSLCESDSKWGYDLYDTVTGKAKRKVNFAEALEMHPFQEEDTTGSF
jgi:hypothetical protein